MCARRPNGAAVVAAWANRARDLANEPPNSLTPAALAAHAESFAAASPHLTAGALGPDEIAELGMGAFAGVAAGSHNPAAADRHALRPAGRVLATSSWAWSARRSRSTRAGSRSRAPLYMEDMKGDMAGGGAVIAGMGAIAELGLPVRALAVVAATENMVGGGAYRPGDILRAANGKTIEVVNTDAEGRLVLADALWYATPRGRDARRRLRDADGDDGEGARRPLRRRVRHARRVARPRVAAGEASGDHAWPLPLHPRYRRYVDSDYADLKNQNVRGQASPAYAAEFLQGVRRRGPVGAHRHGRHRLLHVVARRLPLAARRHRVRRAADRRARPAARFA